MTTNLPPKLYFRIGEVSSLVGVEPHVLRYWEREFRVIRPTKSAKGQRVYSRRDVENLQRVRELLYTDGFTIAGARKQLSTVQKQGAAVALRDTSDTSDTEDDAIGPLADDEALARDDAQRDAEKEIAPRVDSQPQVLRTVKSAANAVIHPQNEARERTLTQLRELRTEVQAFLEELGG